MRLTKRACAVLFLCLGLGTSFVRAATSTLLLDAAGNLGVGTTVPVQKLEVRGVFKADYFSGDGTGLTYTSSPWITNGAAIYRHNVGAVGIGTSDPVAQLHAAYSGVDATIYVTSNSATYIPGWLFGVNYPSATTWGGMGVKSGYLLFTVTGSFNTPTITVNSTGSTGMGSTSALTTPSMMITSSGCVGISSISPTRTLNVKGSANVTGEVEFGGVSGDGSGKAVCIKADGDLGTCSTASDGSGLCTCG